MMMISPTSTVSMKRTPCPKTPTTWAGASYSEGRAGDIQYCGWAAWHHTGWPFKVSAHPAWQGGWGRGGLGGGGRGRRGCWGYWLHWTSPETQQVKLILYKKVCGWEGKQKNVFLKTNRYFLSLQDKESGQEVEEHIAQHLWHECA